MTLVREDDILRYLFKIILVTLIFHATASFGCGGADRVRALDVISDEANKALRQRDFAKVDAMAQEFRDKNSLATDGQPKLMGFYSGVSKSSAACNGSIGTGEEWAADKQLLLDWSRVSPQSVSAKLALALFEVSYGWNARGSGYASTVTDEGWKLFRQRIANARTMLEKLESEVANDPHWFEGMLSIALAQGWERGQFDALYQRAVGKFPYYYAYYFTKGNFYSAQWHGSQADFKQFVEESVQATEKNLGQSMYARLNWSAQNGSMFRNGQTDWLRMKQGFEIILKDFPDSWNRNNFAKFACRAGDKKVLLEQLALVGNKIAISAWGSMEYFQNCSKFARGES